MAILVIEEGAANGTDLVMGDHHVNGFAKAKAADQKIVKVVDLGDDFGMAGVRLDVAYDETGEYLCVLLLLDAGKNSRVVGLQVVPTILAELGRIKIDTLKASIIEVLAPKAPEQPV